LGHVGFWLALFMCALIAAFSLWYTSSGQFPEFPHIQNDYLDLGQAFLNGHLALEEQPDPRLAELSNPYDYKQRKNLPYHWDASYFQGKYYLYWGPVPGLVAAGVQRTSGARLPASLLVDLPYLGLLPVLLALLLRLSTCFPASAARGTLWFFMLVGFVNLPLLILIGQPRHYQASIIYGQFFLLLGLLAFVCAAASGRRAWLTLAGLGWGLAVACRYNLAISAGIYVLFALAWLWGVPRRGHFVVRAGLLLIPLALCFAGLALYDAARFGNPLETGLTYQLTIPEFREISYSISYIPSNLYVYLLYPITGTGAFPFIQSPHFRLALLPAWAAVPPGREFDQAVFGIFRSIPFLWLSILVIPVLFLGIRRSHEHTASAEATLRRLLFTMMASAAAAQFVFLLVFFYAAERYVVDFYLPLVVCLALVMWRVDEVLRRNRPLRIGLWFVVAVLGLWTAAIGYFACFGVPTLVGNFYEPAMLAQLASFWNSSYASLRALLHVELG
jgi:hypothetical protein